MNTVGTPKNLKEAICNALREMFPEERFQPDDSNVQRFHDHIQDRLAQSFGSHMFRDDSASDVVMDLWRSIFPKKH